MLAGGFYAAVPACGPKYSWSALADHPRNCFPSMHMPWALLLLWNSHQWGNAERFMVWLFAAFTALSTLSSGEHYLIDLVVAFPFASIAQAAVDQRWRKAMLSAAAMIAWTTYFVLGAVTRGNWIMCAMTVLVFGFYDQIDCSCGSAWGGRRHSSLRLPRLWA